VRDVRFSRIVRFEARRKVSTGICTKPPHLPPPAPPPLSPLTSHLSPLTSLSPARVGTRTNLAVQTKLERNLLDFAHDLCDNWSQHRTSGFSS